MSAEITSLGGIEYFKDQQCIAFFEIPQNHSEDKEIIQGVLSYQSDGISFSFLIEYDEAIKSMDSIDPKYKVLYILVNKWKYTVYNPLSRPSFNVTLGGFAQITLKYEWLFKAWINPRTINGEHFVCRINYLEGFLTKGRHLLYNELEHKDENFDLQSFWVQKDYLSDKFKNDKIKVEHRCALSQQSRLFSCRYDLSLKCSLAFENLENLTFITEAIRDFFVLIFAYSNIDIQIDYIRFHQKDYGEDITAIRDTYIKDREQIQIDLYGIAIQFQQIKNFSSILEHWIDFCIKNKDSQYIANMLAIINKKERSIHLYSDLLLLISMIEGFVRDQKLVKNDEKKQKEKLGELENAMKILKENKVLKEDIINDYENILKNTIIDDTLRKKLSTFFSKALSKTQCKETKKYFNSKYRKKLCQNVSDYRNALAHGKPLELNKKRMIEISNAYTDLKQIIIEYFFSEIGLSQFIPHNRGFSRTLFRRNPKENR